LMAGLAIAKCVLSLECEEPTPLFYPATAGKRSVWTVFGAFARARPAGYRSRTPRATSEPQENHAMAEWLEPGTRAPDFSLASDAGTKVKLSQLRGKPVVLYFYPKDDTPGCTREACAFRDRKAALARLGAQVLGVSADAVASHEKFRDK